MKKIAALIIFLFMVSVGYKIFQSDKSTRSTLPENLTEKNLVTQNRQNPQEVEKFAIIAQNLDTPWGMVFLPDGSMLFTERQGTVRAVSVNGELDPASVANIEKVREIGEGGLLGITIHPNFANNNYVYLYYTYSSAGEGTLNRVVRMKYGDNKLTEEEVIVDKIPGAVNHNGGRIKFGPDNFLYITTGDAGNPSEAQNKNSLAGKILRVTDTGKSATGNPFGNLVYSYGHRNSQGLTWDNNGNLWSTEHGRSAPTGFDELNLIKPGQNYGWPDIQGDESKSGMITPVINSGPTTVWAPGGAAYLNGSVFFVGLRGQALYQAFIENNKVSTFKEHFKGEYGRIRDIVVGPDSMLYITTSNRDGRGNPNDADDRIIRINPNLL